MRASSCWASRSVSRTTTYPDTPYFIADLAARRARHGLAAMKYGVSGYVVVRETEREAQQELARITDVKQSAGGYENYQQWLAGTQLEQRVSLEDYSVSNRGLRSGLVGTAEQVA